MAAGLGTRLRPFTEQVTKPLLPLLGVPILQYTLDAIAEAGVKRFSINLHYLAEKTKKQISNLDFHGMSSHFSDESQRLLGSGGGIRKMVDGLKSSKSFFLINSDVLFDVDLNALALCHAKNQAHFGALMTLAIFQSPPEGGKYREIVLSGNDHSPNSAAQKIIQLGEVTSGQPFFIGAAVLEPEAVLHLPLEQPLEFVPEILEPAIRSGKAGAFCTSGLWVDIGNPQLWAQSHFELIQRIETGNLSSRLRRRIENHNVRRGQHLWISKNSPSKIPTGNWQGPAYWDAEQNSTAQVPEEFGPDAILYGECEKHKKMKSVLNFHGITQALKST